MTDDTENTDLAEMSDEEIQDLSREFASATADAMSQAFGFDLRENLDENEKREFENEFPDQIEEMFLGIRDAQSKGSEEERSRAMLKVYDELIKDAILEPEEKPQHQGGFEYITTQLRITVEGSRKAMEGLGYPEYFDLIDEFAAEIVESGEIEEVKEFFESLDGNSQQILLQRIMNPVLMEYYEFLEEHPEITNANEARKYADIYYELAELVGNTLPHFVAVLQITNGRGQEYEKLANMRLNNLLQKLGSKEYERFNILADGLDRNLRNSIAHRDYSVDPIEEGIEFYDRGELAADLSYQEFHEEVYHLLALFNALWIFRLLLNHYRLEQVVQFDEKGERTNDE